MSGIPEHVIEEVRDRADVVEVIGEDVQLKKRGKNWVGLCPFHPEKTPSFNVTPEKQMYYCFGCQAGGNVFTYLMETRKMAFPEAVRSLGERYGVEVPETTDEGPDPYGPVHEANRLAADFWHRRLLEADDAKPARAYLEGRGLERDTWETFLLGWAPDEWEALQEEAGRHGIEEGVLLEAGLAGRSEKTGGVYDRFRGRLVFPIRSNAGKVIAFSGRRLDDEPPKYLNSTDTPVFNKGRTLFNLDLARPAIRRAGAAILVEGNFDVVGLHQAGFRNVVAPLGTSFTTEQARILKRYTSTAYLAYDGDEAGERSAFKTGDVLLESGFAVRIVRVPEGEDPDSLILEAGPGAFRDLVERSLDVIDLKIEIVKERIDLSDVMKKRRAIRRLMESVAKVPDPMTRSLYMDKIAAELRVGRDALEDPRPKSPRADRRAAAGGGSAGGGRSGPSRRRARSGFEGEVRVEGSQHEHILLIHAVTDVKWLDQLRTVVEPEWFENEAYRRFFVRLGEWRDERGEEALERLRTTEDAGIVRGLARIETLRARREWGFEVSQKAFDDSLQRVLDRAFERAADRAPDAGDAGDALDRVVRRRELKRGLSPRRLEGLREVVEGNRPPAGDSDEATTETGTDPGRDPGPDEV